MPTLLEKIVADASVRLPLPTGQQPSRELARYKGFLKVESHRLKILHRAGAGGREICQAHAAVLDVLLGSILEVVRNNTRVESKSAPPAFTLVAIGGYGHGDPKILNVILQISFDFIRNFDGSAGFYPRRGTPVRLIR